MRRKEILFAWKKKDITLQKEDGKSTTQQVWCAVVLSAPRGDVSLLLRTEIGFL